MIVTIVFNDGTTKTLVNNTFYSWGRGNFIQILEEERYVYYPTYTIKEIIVDK